MKKILFATTALVATAGVASADIALTGMAEMGVYDNGNDDVQFFTDIDVTFTMSGEADNGLTFGASIDLDESDGQNAVTTQSGAFGPATQGGESIFVAFGGMRLTMGDTDGALDNLVPEMALAGGSIADDETIHGAFVNHDNVDGLGDGQVVRFDYTFDAFRFSLSAEQLANGASVANVGETIWGIGAQYSGDLGGVTLTAGLGYQTLDNVADTWALGVTAGFANGFTAGANYTEVDPNGANNTATAWNIGVGYTMNALAIGANFGEIDPAGPNNNVSGFGLAATYDLGGGLQARLGYGLTDPDGANNDVDTWSLGMRMNF